MLSISRISEYEGGFAANAFGGVEQASNSNPPLALDPQHNILAAIVRWVEEDVAPNTLTAVNYNNNDVDNGIGFTRPLCRVSEQFLVLLWGELIEYTVPKQSEVQRRKPQQC